MKAARRASATLLLAALTSAASGCGSNEPHDGSAKSTTAHKRDRDYDFDNNSDDGEILDYGHAASAADRRAVGALLHRYYRAAASENGAQACAQLDPVLAESVPEQFNDSTRLRAPTCAGALTKIFRLDHHKLSGEATVKVVLVRVKGERSLSMLSFANNPAVRQIAARRENGHWKLRELFDSLVE